MKQFIVLAVAATLFGFVLASSHDGSYRGGYGGHRRNQGYGSYGCMWNNCI